MNPAAFLRHLQSLPGYGGQLAHVEHLAARPPRYGALSRPLAAPLAASLAHQGLRDLYVHQTAGIEAVRRGENVVVATSTASGKTLVYNLPVLEAVLQDRRNRALYLFPTKALAQDQLRSLGELTEGYVPTLRYGSFDGDTPQSRRGAIKKTANIVLSNPDMLSLGILPNHTSWNTFFGHLRYVVIDEAHAYRGVFGSHVANVIRRLRRICRFYHSNPIFISCSATIANPQEHVQRLTGAPATVVADDGSPHGLREFAFWNPPLLPGDVARRSANSEAVLLFTELVKAGTRNITFTKSRKAAELVLLYAREVLGRDAPDLLPAIASYRAGYRPEDRREIEQALSRGRLTGVTATNALELGVDIGRLDATVLTGYPGSIASTWQQAGRSGRGRDQALSVLIGMDNPLDQYLMRHPEEFFRKPLESALIDPDNPYILPLHLLCAAYELPLSRQDEAAFGGEAPFEQAMVSLEKGGLISYAGDRWFYAGMSYPAQDVNIRSISGQYFSMLDRSNGCRLLETIDPSLAYYQAHPGAVYLHQGDSYLVDTLDLTTRNIYVRPADVGYYTQARDTTDVRIIRSVKSREGAGSGAAVGSAGLQAGLPGDSPAAHWGQIRVTTQVIGFRRKQQFTDAVLADEPLTLPAQSYETMAVWFGVPSSAVQELRQRGLDLAGGLHAVEHAAIGILPLYAMCDRNDIGGVSTLCHPDTGEAQVFIYDAFPGGVGISEKAYSILPDLWTSTLRLLAECPCQEGCPACVYSPKCGNNNEPLDKQAAQVILTKLLNG